MLVGVFFFFLWPLPDSGNWCTAAAADDDLGLTIASWAWAGLAQRAPSVLAEGVAAGGLTVGWVQPSRQR